MDANTFFGIDSGRSEYDIRRHINVIFFEIITYNIHAIPNVSDNIKIIVSSGQSVSEKAQDMFEYCMNDECFCYLKSLQDRYGLSSNDFDTIMSGIGLCGFVRTPAGYFREQNLSLIVQMMIARAYLSPKDENAIVKINTMIYQLARGMRGISIDHKTFQTLIDLTYDGLLRYGTNYSAIEQMAIREWQ